MSARKWDSWQQRLTEAAKNVGDVISRTAASAQELLRDQELRKKGLAVVISGAQSRLQGIQDGIQRSADKFGERLQSNKRNLQNLLAGLEQQLQTYQRTRQLHQQRRQRVDVQFGAQLLADVPQELRTRLWYVLLENPNLALPLECERSLSTSQHLDGSSTSGAGPAAPSLDAPAAGALGEGPSSSGFAGTMPRTAGGAASPFQAVQEAAGADAAASAVIAPAAEAPPAPADDAPGTSQELPQAPVQQQEEAAGEEPSTGQAGEAVAEPQAPSTAFFEDSTLLQQAAELLGIVSPPCTTPNVPEARTPHAGTSEGGAEPAGTSPTSPSPAAVQQQQLRQATSRLMHGGTMSSGGGMTEEDWVVLDGGLMGMDMIPAGTSETNGQSAAVRYITRMLDSIGSQPLDVSCAGAVAVARQSVLKAMLEVPWVEGIGLPHDYPEECRFAMLNDITAGQEEIDDSIMRDIHRTFPEHPYFGLEEGQKALFRVLKAYSLHDLEVAYCQGMAFAAGVLLMFVPEEPAFRLFCRLMDPEGPNLRRLYLPGLDALKTELATFELLLSWRMKQLHDHLQAFGLPPVLYVSQWLMTLFATPFPPSFCARVIDVLLQDGHDTVLQRCSYALMEELHDGLLGLNDFEALITYLKMEPVQWDIVRQREVFERALNSPLTRAELAMARDLAASREFLQSVGGAGHQEQQMVADAAAAAVGILPEQASLEFEAALQTAAAAAADGAGSSGATPRQGGSGSGAGGASRTDVQQRQFGGQGAGSSLAGAADVDLDTAGAALLQTHAHHHVKIPGLDLDDEYLEMIMDLNLLGEPVATAAGGSAPAGPDPAHPAGGHGLGLNFFD